MDLEVEIKEEPIWPEDTANTSFDSYINSTVDNDGVESHTSDIPKVEKEPLDPRSEDEMTIPAADIKDEIVKEECTVDQLTPISQEENNVKNVAVLTNGTGPYSCNVCISTFSQRCNLRDHLTTHSGERPYCCAICNNKFALKQKLKRHLLTHSGSRPYTCNICDGTFALKQGLKRHMLIHSGQRPYCCRECNRKFSQSAHLKRHLLTICGKRGT